MSQVIISGSNYVGGHNVQGDNNIVGNPQEPYKSIDRMTPAELRQERGRRSQLIANAAKNNQEQ